ncbi:UdgX family uracil-DNA binding protein [Roseobacter sp. HKCCA0434]|uniref:UdgX family uracil-DNA binding protein n=1 Tax=Roseobacter sp. HKCCA0434 TaxID=3079297 RepID=UPI002905F706|nr:UdgX family uracil-DNA binding protein [Roseobacter sp. HKCCA0434]
MIAARLASQTDYDGWRQAARALATNGVGAEDVDWQVGAAGLFDAIEGDLPPPRGELRVPRAFPQLAQNIICHRDPERFAKLYRLLLRLQREPGALADEVDDLVRWARKTDKEIRRDLHKMHAFVRFRKLGERDGREVFVSWFEPSHRIEQRTAGFFVDRFTGMDWAILTPEARIIWDGGELSFGPGGSPAEVPESDAIEDQWRGYYRAIFNPARLKPKAMQAEMPKKYWKNLPEAALIPSLMAEADGRARQMQDAGPTAPAPLTDRMKRPEREVDLTTLDGVRRAAATCTACPLHCSATQTVFGEGPARARLMLVGEQPGDREDLAGRPFVGPAGTLLRDRMQAAGIDAGQTYLTNAVKHFKFTVRGKRRIHQNPSAGEIDVCRQWFERERDLVQPDLTLALGASAARAIVGRAVRLSDMRGDVIEMPGGGRAAFTVHPSYLLRLPDPQRKAEELARFDADLRAAMQIAGG